MPYPFPVIGLGLARPESNNSLKSPILDQRRMQSRSRLLVHVLQSREQLSSPAAT
jgi:hypothetical protein